ncbi:TetR/AcrR family transcriptional regulator [Mesorhizobium sp. ANAO-SY3R2]|uniref:TetR/AcrR family transcriptional regulator n=1 Tax=Mesorhizobium sp. ANAO-SY3R2 TaxID=3166644 RepID=UPI0036704082
MTDLQQTPRRPTRAPGRKRYETLLDSAEQLLATRPIASLTLQEVADHADCPIASIYHYFPSIAAVYVGLAERYHGQFRQIFIDPIDIKAVHGWQDICRIHSERGRQVYARNPAAVQLFLGPDIGSQMRQMDLEYNKEFGLLQYRTMQSLFVVPEKRMVVEHLAISTTISDAIWSLSYALHKRITKELAEEAMRAKLAYLSLYIPPCAPRIDGQAAPQSNDGA